MKTQKLKGKISAGELTEGVVDCRKLQEEIEAIVPDGVTVAINPAYEDGELQFINYVIVQEKGSGFTADKLKDVVKKHVPGLGDMERIKQVREKAQSDAQEMKSLPQRVKALENELQAVLSLLQSQGKSKAPDKA